MVREVVDSGNAPRKQWFVLVGSRLVCYGSKKSVATRKGDDVVGMESSTTESTKTVSFPRGPIGLQLETDAFLDVTTVKGFSSKDSLAKMYSR